MPRISRSVRDFVLPLEPTGSLDASLSFQMEEDAAVQGSRLHAKVQKRLKREFPDLQSERTVLHSFERPHGARKVDGEGEVKDECQMDDEDGVKDEVFECLVRGRIDVFIPGPRPILEEIKTTYRPQALLKALAASPAHPFAQQVRMYAWIHAQKDWPQKGAPACRIRVISLLDESETLVDVPFDPEAFGAWVESQVEGLQAQFLRSEARARQRRDLGQALGFPFESLRPGQRALQDLVARSLEEGQPLLLQAPTGLGKTAGVLHPALKRALEEDQRVFYLTPRNTQHAVAEAFVRRLNGAGHGVRSITIRAKERVCPQDEVHCHPDRCPRADGYYDRLGTSGALEALAGLGCADSATVCALAQTHALCPFELSLDAAKHADVIIGDYNYGLSPNATLHRFFAIEEEEHRNILLLDEAHNLPGRAAAWFSPALDAADLEAMKRGWPRQGPGASIKGAFTRQMQRCLRLLTSHEGPHRSLEVDATLFGAEEQRIRGLLAKAAAQGMDLAPSHPLVRLFQTWSEFCEALRERTPASLLTWIPPGRLQITCMDASQHLAQRFKPLAGLVLFSATLKPFEYYERLSGLAGTRREEIASPFPAQHRRVLIVPQISTLYRQRSRQAPRIGQFLSRVLPARLGNYLVFFPSFEFLDQVQPHLDLPGFRVLAQPRRAAPETLDEILSSLNRERGLVVLAVQGGSLSEGVDLPGEALIGCVVVGPPLPPFDLERKLTKAYFDRTWGPDAGEACTYTYPAMARAIQAAGRVIRGPEEWGLLVFLDGRFLEPEYARCFPGDWFHGNAREAVSDRILADVGEFWARGIPAIG